LYYIEIIFTRLLLFYCRFRVTGKENVPPKGGLLVVANHISMADPPIVGVSMGRRVVFMAKEELFRNWFIRFIISNFGAFPVRRGGFTLEALRIAKSVLDGGGTLAMFPEGRRSMKVGLLAGLPGSALLANASKVPVLPVGIYGTEKVKGFWSFMKRPEMTVNIGKPFFLPPNIDEKDRGKLREWTDAIMLHIAELLPERYRGVYAGKED
jgi:1-acyl-sn-glycerol-3-phosphate acyltransferase